MALYTQIPGDFKRQIVQHLNASEFFRILKKYDRPRYQIAIKKFINQLKKIVNTLFWQDLNIQKSIFTLKY